MNKNKFAVEKPVKQYLEQMVKLSISSVWRMDDSQEKHGKTEKQTRPEEN